MHMQVTLPTYLEGIGGREKVLINYDVVPYLAASLRRGLFIYSFKTSAND